MLGPIACGFIGAGCYIVGKFVLQGVLGLGVYAAAKNKDELKKDMAELVEAKRKLGAIGHQIIEKALFDPKKEELEQPTPEEKEEIKRLFNEAALKNKTG